jgi:pyruvate dehydrogenase E2 component (dihydrolipoamide acetyltransferase)
MAMNEYFDISRKIVANMTSQSWRSIPHVSVLLEADVSMLLPLLREYNGTHDTSISLNSAIMKVIAEGLREYPNLNGRIQYNAWLVSGKFTPSEHVDVSMPIHYGDGKMITITIPQVETLSMLQIQETVSKMRDRIDHTDMPWVLYKTGLQDTFEGLRNGKLITAAGRLIGAKFGQGRVKHSQSGKGIHPDSLQTSDIRQGSVTVSNMGSMYRNWNGHIIMLEIVPPQVCAIGIGALQKKAVIGKDQQVNVSDILPITICFDHRALDFSDVVPFMDFLTENLRDQKIIKTWIESPLL